MQNCYLLFSHPIVLSFHGYYTHWPYVDLFTPAMICNKDQGRVFADWLDLPPSRARLAEGTFLEPS